MKTFTDAAGRKWEILVTVGAVKRVRDLLAVDLVDAGNGDLLKRLADDPCLLVNVIYALCKPAADAAGVTDEDFGRAMVGDVLDAASAALIGDLIDFFPRTLRMRAQGRLLAALEEAASDARALAQVAARLQGAGLLPTKSGDGSGDLPASSASTPPA